MKKVHHIVLVKFALEKAHLSDRLLADLEALRPNIPGFLTLTGGAEVSQEGLNNGYTHGLVMTFTDATTRDHYLTHPDHEKVKQWLLPEIEGILVFDFEGE